MDARPDLSAREAARVVAQAQAWDRALARRAEGAIWMVWGIVVPAIFLSYAFASDVHLGGGYEPVLWAPWSAAGILATIAIQRVARPQAPAEPAPRKKATLVGVAVVALAFTTMGILLRPATAEVPLLVIGAVWAFAAAANAFRFTWEGRTMVAASGVGCLVVAGALGLLRPSDDVVGLVAAIATGVLTLGTGFARVLQG
jgi:hypothetical protein